MRLIVATKNPGKVREFKEILEPLGFEVVSQTEAGVSLDVEETGTTFAENAALKARAIYQATGCATVADDSGLAVDALDGAPGVYSARYAGEGASDAERNQKLLHALADVPKGKRTAQFICAIHLILPTEGSTPEEITAHGECPGVIGFAPRGENGFGYDPLFYVANGKSFAELSAEEKNQCSHRARALAQMTRELENRS